MTEKWKRIPGFGDFYEVSDQGRIRRLKVRGRWSPTYKVDRYLTPSLSRYGYLLTRLIDKDGKYHYVRVHRIVALTFLGPAPKSQPETNHLNGNKTDNRASNLVWASRRENALHSTRTLKKNRGVTHGMSKLNARQVRQIRAARERGASYRVLAERYGVSKPTIYGIVSGRTWQHVI